MKVTATLIIFAVIIGLVLAGGQYGASGGYGGGYAGYGGGGYGKGSGRQYGSGYGGGYAGQGGDYAVPHSGQYTGHYGQGYGDYPTAAPSYGHSSYSAGGYGSGYKGGYAREAVVPVAAVATLLEPVSVTASNADVVVASQVPAVSLLEFMSLGGAMNGVIGISVFPETFVVFMFRSQRNCQG
ncbi:hypothetical protein HPB50_010539 [Hyalomma asiaticum]|uniref:Uncharacterized protein n=1 Tax=Hyalomma asiaticum TaxID=266040 RepID=A0ACB7S5U7_HYAAI|nr:hypothetical protein HPB50_010539 [Hyalomma asiaticum]